MARQFASADSEYLVVDSAPFITSPHTMACWFFMDDVDSEGYMMTVHDKDQSLKWVSLALRGDEAGDKVEHRFLDSNIRAVTSTGATISTWHHACGVAASTTSRAAYIDGGSKGTNASTHTYATYDRTTISSEQGTSPSRYFNGRIAEAAIWNVALLDAEIDLLAKGFSPLFFQPQNLVFYAPLIRDEDFDKVGGLSLTPTNSPTVETHPPKIIYPAPPFISYPTAAAVVAIPNQAVQVEQAVNRASTY